MQRAIYAANYAVNLCKLHTDISNNPLIFYVLTDKAIAMNLKPIMNWVQKNFSTCELDLV